MRKDDLIIVPTTGKLLRAPDNFQRTFASIFLPANVRRILAMSIDTLGFRILVEKKNKVHLLRVSCLGKLFSDHVMPISLNTLCRTVSKSKLGIKPCLENYGDGFKDGVLALRDATGNLVPLMRNAAGGFREPPYVGLGRMHEFAIGVRYLNNPDEINCFTISSCEQLCASKKKLTSSKTANRVIIIATLIAPSPESTMPIIPSLMQAILYCNVQLVRYVLEKLLSLEGDDANEIRRNAILDDRVDGNRNILHVVTMNAFSITNKDQADIGKDDLLIKIDTSEADSARSTFDRKWQEMIGSQSSGSKSSKQCGKENADKEMLQFSCIPQANKDRQSNAIEICKTIVNHSVIQPFFLELIKERDIHGQTPFNCAVQVRAYSAASIIWNAIKNWKNLSNQNKLTDEITLKYNLVDFISGTKPDDLPTFVLCYNDTCSFTWTGEEHVNQDIFECKTCRLTGTFCCCTECAYTCHRNHDCKLKRTSPTAYCDCWEKCVCKALVTGNVVQREYLLTELLNHTNLIVNLNSRGEHLLLFLAKTVGRQLVEQDNFVRQINKIRSTHQNQQNVNNSESNVPEHDLEPPKFARRAFELVLSNWSAVKSLLKVGLKETKEEAIVVEELFCLGEQNGCTHLDKFVFILLARCQETHLNTLINTLIYQANLKNNERDPEIDFLISRFVRSVIRLFSLIIVLSPSAAGIVLSAIANNINDPDFAANHLSTSTSVNTSSNSGTTKTVLSNYRAVAISGMLSLVRASLPPVLSNTAAKDSKKKLLNNFVLKSRRVFQALVTYSIIELLNSADALIAPVRLGIIKPSTFSSSSFPSDVLDVLERYLFNEKDLSTLLANSEEKDLINKGILKKESEQKSISNNIGTNQQNRHRRDDSDSDMDSENNDHESRPVNSQNSITRAVEETTNVQSNTTERSSIKRRTQIKRSNHRRVVGIGQEIETIYADSTDSLSSPSDDENDSEEDDDEDESSANEYDTKNDRFGQTRSGMTENLNGEESEGNQDEEDEDEEEHEMDDEEEDGYFNVEDQEEEVESGDGTHDEVNNEGVASVGDSNETAPAGQEEVSVELMDTNDNVSTPETSANVVDAHTTEIYIPIRGVVDETSNNSTSSNTPFVRSIHQSSRLNDTSSNAAPTLNWAVNRVRQESESSNVRESSENQSIETNRNENRANNETENSSSAANIAEEAFANATPSRLRYRGEGNLDEINNVLGHTGMQLSMCFSVLIKMVDELTLELIHYNLWLKNGQKDIPVLLEFDDRLLPVIRKTITKHLEPTWNWLYIIMDRTEAKLKFGNSLASSSVGAFIANNINAGKTKPVKKIDEKLLKKGETENKKDLSESDVNTNANRSELCMYFLSLLRSHSSENGDDLPVIEFHALKSIAFVVETFLFHINLTDEFDSEILPQLKINKNLDVDNTALEETKNLRRFYQRSKSICYPLISTADTHHAFKYSAETCLPLATRSHLLKPDADKDALFALPIPHRTRAMHMKIAKDHGVLYPNHQGFADPPLIYRDIINKLNSNNDNNHDHEKMEVDDIIVDCSKTLNNIPDLLKNDKFDIDILFGEKTSASRIALQRCLGRWSNTTLFLSKAFHEQIIKCCGGDASLSILLNETAGYFVRQSQFKQRMEKFKAGQTKDLVFSQLMRDKYMLFSSTIRQLNQQYLRRIANNSSATDVLLNPVLASQKVKVTFRDEPGEGTGVARSFYSAIAEAFLTMTTLPLDLEIVTEEGASLPGDLGDGTEWKRPQPTSSPTRNFFSKLSKRSEMRQSSEGNSDNNGNDTYRIRTRSQRLQQVASSGSATSSTSRRSAKSKTLKEERKIEVLKPEKPISNRKGDLLDPLFYKVNKLGFYTVVPGDNSSTRLNAFRNVGRIIGTCLQQMEILPLFLCRHIFKFILNRPITWFDLAFFDPGMFDSIRKIVYNEVHDIPFKQEFYDCLELTFAVDVNEAEGGGVIELKSGGAEIPVTRDNVLEYVYLFVKNRLVGNNQLNCLKAIKAGVYDVLPVDALEHLTAEDLRLILCGTQEISLNLLQSYTNFLDESSAPADVLARYKQWFWEVVSTFSDVEKQDLIFFWTGSPSLPSTENAFQPLPSIMIRPADDHHLPTANTCISRLYLPLYSSKKIMRSKTLLAIKARNFGFV